MERETEETREKREGQEENLTELDLLESFDDLNIESILHRDGCG